ncbi:MAG: transporter substrate-binding domain-containing protein [Limnochordales bacterium]
MRALSCLDPRVDRERLARTALAARLDAVVTDRLVAIMIIGERGYDMELVGDLLYTENIGIAVRHQDEDLRIAIDEALTSMYEDGTYTAISHKWFGTDIR